MEYFVAVAEELHFGRAAARLHIAQPSLSHEIRVLERRLGVRLLNRTSRRVELTPAGNELLTHGRRLLAQAQRAIEITRAAGSEQLTVGFYGSAASSLLPEVLRVFGERRPAAEVRVRELLLDRVDDLVNGLVDVAFTRLLPGQADVELHVLVHESRVVALPITHALASRMSVTFADLRDESFVVNPATRATGSPSRWLAEQQRHGLPGRVAAEAASIQEILTIVAAGRAVCLVPAPVAVQYPRHDVRFVEVTDADPAVVSLAWNAENMRPIVEDFIEAAHEVAGAHTVSE